MALRFKTLKCGFCRGKFQSRVCPSLGVRKFCSQTCSNRFNSRINPPWNKGLHTGPSWNKGLTKETNDSVARIAAKARGRKQSKEHIEKIQCKRRGIYKASAETRLRHSEAMKRSWRNPKSGHRRMSHRKMSLAAKKRVEGKLWGQWLVWGKKNYLERRVEIALNILYPKDFKYCGDKSVCIGRKFPDFINVNGRKEVVEVFGDTVHGPSFTGRRRCDEVRQKKSHYKKWGFNCAVLWGKDIRLGAEHVAEKLYMQLGR